MSDRQARLVKALDEDIFPMDDGYHAFWVQNKGALTAHDLRLIANELDRRNEPWEKQMKQYFEREEDVRS